MADAAQQNPWQAISLQAVEQALHELPDVADRLRYVKQLTEGAANKVFALVETAQAQAGELERHAAQLQASAPEAAALLLQQAQAQQAWATELLMSQDFQDLSGQVVNKVIGLLQSLEEPLQQLLDTAGSQAQDHSQMGELAGVQTPDKALKQDDVDDLLASLGF